MLCRKENTGKGHAIFYNPPLDLLVPTFCFSQCLHYASLFRNFIASMPHRRWSPLTFCLSLCLRCASLLRIFIASLPLALVRPVDLFNEDRLVRRSSS